MQNDTANPTTTAVGNTPPQDMGQTPPAPPPFEATPMTTDAPVPPMPATPPTDATPAEAGGFPQPTETADTPPPPPVINGGATPTTPTFVPGNKGGRGRGKIIATIFGIIVLVGGVGAGVLAIRTTVLTRPKADDAACNSCGSGCGPGSSCNNVGANIWCPGGVFVCQHDHDVTPAPTAAPTAAPTNPPGGGGDGPTPPTVPAGNNCCGDPSYQNGRGGACYDDWQYLAGYNACVSHGCDKCRESTGPTPPPGSPCNSDGLCRSGENETVCPNDCGPGGVDLNPPASPTPYSGTGGVGDIDCGGGIYCVDNNDGVNPCCISLNAVAYTGCPQPAFCRSKDKTCNQTASDMQCLGAGTTGECPVGSVWMKYSCPNQFGVGERGCQQNAQGPFNSKPSFTSPYCGTQQIDCSDNVNFQSQESNSGCAVAPTPTPPGQTPTPPGQTPTPPGPSAQCIDVEAWDTDWNPLTPAQLTTLSAGDIVRFTVKGSATSGSFDRARFTINTALRAEVTDTKPTTGEFYDEYTIPDGVTSFTIKGEIHHISLGWR